MLTTVDNPWDPFTQFSEWFVFDVQHGYNSSGLLARVLRSSDNLSEPDQQIALEKAIDEIVEINVLGIFRKVSREV